MARYKKEKDDYVLGPDVLRMNIHVSEEERNERYSVCLKCRSLNKRKRMCKKCYCHMPFKTWLKDSECPIGKW